MSKIDIAQEIDRFREKLLDIRTTNRLLSYRKTRTRTLQIVDELPNQVFERLVVAGKAFSFLPLKNDDAPEMFSGAVSHELPEHPESSGSIRKEHTDSKLQTDLDGERLNSVLKSMRRDANSVVLETGVNCLYLALGMLGWYESHNSEREHLAPLILIPIEIKRKFSERSQCYVYETRHTGEELQTNLSLSKRLESDFGISLPEFEDGQTPEDYFGLVSDRISMHSRWRLRREALLGFFSFRKLLMYLDLDPQNWGGSAAFGDKSLVRQLITGGTRDQGAGIFLDDYHIDVHPIADKIVLADNADSSQHSALCDIAVGKSIVIEGPPGTGKSQTITNAIGAALAENKSVLFVSEKLAALEVVKANLTRLGLEPFCLELHSEGARPQAVYSDLRARLEKRFSLPAKLASQKVKLRKQMEKLRAYLTATDKRVGPRDEPVRDLFWRITEMRSRQIPALSDTDIGTDMSESDLEDRTDALTELASHAEEIGSPSIHPWRGCHPVRLTANKREAFKDVLRQLGQDASKLRKLIETLDERVPVEELGWLNCVIQLPDIDLTNLLPADLSVDHHVSSRLLSADRRAVGRQLVEHIHDCHTVLAQASENLIEPIDDSRSASSKIKELVSGFPDRLLGLTTTELTEATSVLQNARNILRQIGESASHLQPFATHPIRTIREFKDTTYRLKLLTHAAVVGEHHLRSELFLTGAEKRFLEAKQTWQKLVELRDTVDSFFDLEDVPDQDEIQAIRKTIRQHASSRWRVFSRDYRAARQQLRVFMRIEAGKSPLDWVAQLEQLDKFLDTKAKFADNRAFRLAIGPLFEGIDTDWQTLETTIRWIRTAKTTGMGYADAIHFLEVRDETASLPDPAEAQELVERCNEELESDLARRLLAVEELEHLKIATLREQVERLIVDLGALEESSRAFRLESSTRLREVNSLADLVLTALEKRDLINKSTQYRHLLGRQFNGIETDTEAITAAADWLDRVDRVPLPQPALEWLNEDCVATRADELFGYLGPIQDKFNCWQQNLQLFGAFGSFDDGWLALGKEDDPFCLEKLHHLEQHRIDALPWADFCRAVDRANLLGLERFTDAIIHDEITAACAPDCFELTLYEQLADSVIAESDVLQGFSRQRIENTRTKFQELDRQILELNREAIAARASQTKIPVGVSRGRVSEFTQLGLINNEIQKQKRFCRIRELVRRAGSALQGLKPCFMMSPLSVAQFLPPGSIEFDIVIMDEASQIKPEDAIGTIIRAKQLVIVGDPKQLPPTSFFERMASADVEEEDATLLDDTESVLEVAMKAFSTLRRLKWHYRSRHECLIAFSNEQFYDGDLIVFPSPAAETGRLGIRFHQVANGVFQGGCNAVEADQIAEAIVQHARENPDESLGVGTFNIGQRRAIEDRLDALCALDTQARLAVERLLENDESLFIKNLENLQGDERDVIFISYTYGPDPNSGRVLNRFGPITGENGWRRLNVLVTRAKSRVEVFSSMSAADIIGGPEKSRGVNAMKDYLTYAQTGVLVDRGTRTGRDPGSPFEEAVARVVRRLGLHVVPQVGVAGYFIDMGVLKPNSTGEFLLGIECDGATYHSAKSARDRDRLREEVIRARGWELYRIWSTDWFMNQEAEERRLEEAIQALLKKPSTPRTSVKAVQPSDNAGPETEVEEKLPPQDSYDGDGVRSATASDEQSAGSA